MSVLIKIDRSGKEVSRSDLGDVIEVPYTLFDVAILTGETGEQFLCLHHGATIVGEYNLKSHLVKYHQRTQENIECVTCATESGTNNLHNAGKAHKACVERRSWSFCTACFAMIKPGVMHANHGEHVKVFEAFDDFGIRNEVIKPTDTQTRSVRQHSELATRGNRGKVANDGANRVVAALSLGSKVAQRKGKIASYPMCAYHLHITVGYKPGDAIPGAEAVKVANSKCKCCEGIGRMLQKEPVSAPDIYVLTSDVSSLRLIESPLNKVNVDSEFPETVQYGEIASLVQKHGPEVMSMYQMDNKEFCFKLKKKVVTAMRTGKYDAYTASSPSTYSEDAAADEADEESDEDPEVTPTEEVSQQKTNEASGVPADSAQGEQERTVKTEQTAEAAPLDTVDGISFGVAKQQLRRAQNQVAEAEARHRELSEHLIRSTGDKKEETKTEPKKVVEKKEISKPVYRYKSRICPKHNRLLLGNGACPHTYCDLNKPSDRVDGNQPAEDQA